jgi:hypothetical protein
MTRNTFCRHAATFLAGILYVSAGGCLLHGGSQPTVGSPNVAVADPAVPRPATKPCIVELFPVEPFGPAGENTRMDAEPHLFKYQPPADCQAPWAKVVLEADFAVDAGRQYDRTASIWLNGVNLYFGTTQEPSRDSGPSWRVERDVTDYSRLLRSAGEGSALINNWVDEKRASVIHASARLVFYPADSRFPAPRTPDAIYPLNSENAAVNVQTGSDQLQRSLNFPQNTARVYVDLIAQSQFHDEEWYNCLPDQYIQQSVAFAAKRGDKGSPAREPACGGGSFREVEVFVDGQPAGLAPVYPWIYTGGIDPYLWRPTPGVQTLNFAPLRVDLTPFAGLVGNGVAHSVAVRVLGANQFFSLAATLLVYRDAQSAKIGGAVTRNTLAGASLEPTVTSTLTPDAPEMNGDVVTRANQSYVIEGYVNTAAGRVSTRVDGTLSFANTQKFSTVDAETTRHVTEQSGHAETTSRSTGTGSAGQSLHRSLDYSLTVDALNHSNADQSSTHTTHLRQTRDQHIEWQETGRPPYRASIQNARTAQDQVTFNPGHTGLAGSTGQTSTQTFSFTDSLGDCYGAEVQAAAGKVTSFTQGQGCGAEPLRWFVHPDGFPDGFGWQEVMGH